MASGRRNWTVWMVVADMAVGEYAPDAPTDPEPPRRHPWRWARLAALCGVVVAGAVVLGYVTNNEIQANTRFDQAHRELDGTRTRLGVARSNLATVSADLRSVDGQVRLDTTTLAQDTAQLQGAEAALADARASVAHQAGAMADLRSCLGGVEQGLNALSVGDRVHALEALTAVSASCTAAIGADG